MKAVLTIIIFAVLGVGGYYAYTKYYSPQDIPENVPTNGTISRCRYNGQVVFKVDQTSFDGGIELYNTKGEKIGYQTSAFSLDPVETNIDFDRLTNCIITDLDN